MTLTNSQAATLSCINEKPGKRSVIAIGQDMAKSLEDAGYITIRKGMCHPTAKAAGFKGRSAREQAESKMQAYVSLMGAYAAMPR